MQLLLDALMHCCAFVSQHRERIYGEYLKHQLQLPKQKPEIWNAQCWGEIQLRRIRETALVSFHVARWLPMYRPLWNLKFKLEGHEHSSPLENTLQSYVLQEKICYPCFKKWYMPNICTACSNPVHPCYMFYQKLTRYRLLLQKLFKICIQNACQI